MPVATTAPSRSPLLPAHARPASVLDAGPEFVDADNDPPTASSSPRAPPRGSSRSTRARPLSAWATRTSATPTHFSEARRGHPQTDTFTVTLVLTVTRDTAAHTDGVLHRQSGGTQGGTPAGPRLPRRHHRSLVHRRALQAGAGQALDLNSTGGDEPSRSALRRVRRDRAERQHACRPGLVQHGASALRRRLPPGHGRPRLRPLGSTTTQPAAAGRRDHAVVHGHRRNGRPHPRGHRRQRRPDHQTLGGASVGSTPPTAPATSSHLPADERRRDRPDVDRRELTLTGLGGAVASQRPSAGDSSTWPRPHRPLPPVPTPPLSRPARSSTPPVR